MIYFYKVKLRYWKNREWFVKTYIVSFAEILEFLIEKKVKNSSMEIYSINAYYGGRYNG